MSGLNKVELIGRLGADPEVRSTNDGRKIVNMNIATSETWRDKSTGERKERTEWHRVVIFNEGLAGIAEQYLKKGSQVYVEGMLQTRKWQDQSGQDRYSTEVVLKQFNGNIVLLGSAGGNGRPAPSEDDYGTTTTRPDSFATGPASGVSPDLDDDIPF